MASFPEVEMAAVNVSILMQKQILELKAKGFADRKIAKTLKVSRNTVKRVLLRGALASPGSIEPDWSKSIDWEKVQLEVSRGVQINILAKELAGDKISYVQFWREYNKKYPSLPYIFCKLRKCVFCKSPLYCIVFSKALFCSFRNFLKLL
jgi:hypothetical protein